MSYKEFKGLVTKLEERGKSKTSDFLMYLVLPFLKSLGYNVYDLDEVDLDMEEELVKIKNRDELSMLVSVDENLLNGISGKEKLNNDELKIYINIGLEQRKIKLYYNVLDKWEEIVTINLDEDNADMYAKDFTKRIAKENLNREIQTNGTRFLTESVLDAKLEAGEWNNDFMMYGLLKELTEPTDEFLQLMAGRLSEDYTTRDIEWIKGHLEKAKEEGFISIVKRLYDNNFIEENKEKEQVDDESEEESTEEYLPEDFEKEGETNEEGSKTEEVSEHDDEDDVEKEYSHEDVKEEILGEDEENESEQEEKDIKKDGYTSIDNFIKNAEAVSNNAEKIDKGTEKESESKGFNSLDDFIDEGEDDEDDGSEGSFQDQINNM